MKLTISLWLILLSLTMLTARIPTLAENSLSANIVVPLVLLATLVKGHIVIDHFMALNRVGGPWRWIVPGWLLLVLGLIGYAFH